MKKTCQYCGETFTPIRNTKKFCADSCRTLYSVHQCSKAERFVGDKKIATHIREYKSLLAGRQRLMFQQWFERVSEELEQLHICKRNTSPPHRRELRTALELVGKNLEESYIPYIE